MGQVTDDFSLSEKYLPTEIVRLREDNVKMRIWVKQAFSDMEKIAHELEDQSACFQKLKSKVYEMDKEAYGQRIKSSLLGGVGGGLITAIVAGILIWLKP